MKIYDVAIVGYGPAGVTLANLLGQAGITVVVFEIEEGVYHAPRASHLDGEVMRIYQSMGLSDKIDPITIGAKGYHFLNSKGERLTELVRKEGKGMHGWNHHYRFHQPVFEQTLRDGVQRFSTVDVFLSHEVMEIQQNQQEVTLMAKNVQTGAVKEARASYLIGCDGARSMVSRKMEAEKEDVGLRQPWLVVDIKLKRETSLPTHGIQYCETARPTTYIPYVGEKDRFRWELMILPGEKREEIEKPENVWKLLSRWVAPEDAVLERAAVYTFHSTVTKGWRKERMFLAGDAAHQMPPFLGQGMCAGIRDVSNLSWKLISVIKGEASDSLLDTYESERSNHVKSFIHLATEVGKIITVIDEEEANLRDEKMVNETGNTIDDPQPTLGEGIHLGGGQPVGTVIPQFTLESGVLIDDVIEGPAFAVLADHELLSEVNEATRKIWEERGIVSIEVSGTEAKTWLSNQNAKAVLIRPDRYIFGIGSTSKELESLTNHLTNMLTK